jgi:hypothetical protein
MLTEVIIKLIAGRIDWTENDQNLLFRLSDETICMEGVVSKKSGCLPIQTMPRYGLIDELKQHKSDR